jgi:predicted nucleic acid-binding protein
VELNEAIAEEAVQVRNSKRLKLPDAIILATARVHGCQLVTRNSKDFDSSWPEVHAPY